MANNNFNILPFYRDPRERQHLKSYSYGDIFNLIAPRAKILPFQIVRPHRADTISKVFLVFFDKPSEAKVNILPQMVAAGLEILTFVDYDIIRNMSKFIFDGLTLDAGRYCLEISDGVDTWYSDIFTVVVDLSPYLKLEYWDRDNIAFKGGHIDYSGGFRNFCYLATEIGKPEYTFEEEAQQRDGFTFVEMQLSEKKYKFEFLAPEYLCDALRIVRLHDFVTIHFAGKKYAVENIILEPKWREQGHIAVVEAEFETDTVIKKIGKGFVPRGDYNADFNNDYNN